MRQFLRTPLAIALLIGLLCGLTEFTEPLDHMMWNIRFKYGGRSLPPSIVLITQNSSSDSSRTRAWSNADQARLLAVVSRQLPERVVLDTPLAASDDPQADRQLAREIAALGADIAVAVRPDQVDQWKAAHYTLPPRAITGTAPILLSSWATNFIGYALFAPYRVRQDGHTYANLAPYLAKATGRSSQFFFAAPEFVPQSVPTISAEHLLSKNPVSGLLTGRTVIISDERQATQRIGYFGHGKLEAVYTDIAASAGFDRPFNADIGWYPELALVGCLLLLSQFIERRTRKAALLVAAAGTALAAPFGLELLGLFSSSGASLVALLTFAGISAWNRWRSRVRHTSASGLPNLLVLSEQPIDVGADVIVAIIARYEEFLATLPAELHAECAQQIARRLAVGCGAAEICHGDGGLFAWIEAARPLEMQLNHLEGLRALFAAPLQIGPHRFDTNIHFGLDRNAGLDPLIRVNSAIASANEALKAGRTSQIYEESRLANAAWDLSLHARIDEGLNNGEIWLAFQPQWDFVAGRISGAEALIRWNHPERGPIRPDEFILQAERAARIDTLTYWVVERAIDAHAALAPLDPGFQMSVNLSGQMVDKPSLVSAFSEIVRRRGIDPRRLTIEITETSGVQNRPAARHNLAQLRSLGFRLSIDDFGTGEASLSYLAELPSDELKLDRRFVAAVTSDERNRKIVASTIRLAHDLDQIVVAEGIEDAATFAQLGAMGCDLAQGYLIGRPVPLAQLVARCANPAPFSVSSIGDQSDIVNERLLRY